MSLRFSQRVALGLLVIAPASHLTAQTLDELVAAGRYEEAAASLTDAGPEEARAGAMVIFNHAYLNEFQRDRFEEAARAFAAVRTVPVLEERERELLDFWQGMAWVSSTRDRSLSEDEVDTRLERARALFEASEEYARRVNMPDAVARVERELALSGRARN